MSEIIRKDLPSHDDNLALIWHSILKVTEEIYRVKNYYLMTKCFTELIEMNPQVKEIAGVTELYDKIKLGIEKGRRTCLNKRKIRISMERNGMFDRSELKYKNSQEDN